MDVREISKYNLIIGWLNIIFLSHNIAELMETVDKLKTSGNQALQNGDVDGAIKFYTDAINEIDKVQGVKDLANSKAAIFSNRCAAYSKGGNYAMALKDAEEAIKVAPTWSKGYSRKGASLAYLGRHKEALDAYNEGLKLDPDNSTLKSGIADVENLMRGK